ncbi:MAG: methionine--tRNA ligase [Candidatus Aenigmarchaeota archaeon]|nr:methionine--tRNA ligase [Candidatus Aenigmarchaeota archaeon]
MIEFKGNIIGSKRVTVTSALPYVTGVKHLGNLAGSMLPADIFHRFLDLLGIPNIYICGTDDYGTATEIAAKQEGMKPKAYCDKYYKIQKEIYKQWNFDFTYFGQTSTPEHTKLVQGVIKTMHKKGYVIKGVLKLPYCNACKKYLADRYVGGECPYCSYDGARGDQCEKCSKVLDPADLRNAYCNICKSKDISFKEEKHLFLDLQSLQPKLKKWIESKQWPENTKNIALAWIKEGLKPRCITRNLEWGIPVPIKGYEHLLVYVWIDAPWGYVSITQHLNEWKKWWTDSKIVHFLGKDNIPFHTIFFPATIMASEKISLPHFVAGYEYLNWEGKKFSTSKGMGLFSDDALKLYPADYWRFYLARILPETKDSNFDWDAFENRINNELIANYGNLFYRVTSFIEKNFSSVPKPGKMGEAEKKLQANLQKKVSEVEQLIDSVRLREALQKIMEISADVNKYFQDKKPWAGKDEETRTALYVSVNALRTITTLLWPYIPETAEKALQALDVKRTKWSDITDFIIKPGHKVQAWMLFKKIEEGEIKRKKIVESITSAMEKKPDLRIASITQAEEHPKAGKLYVLSLDLGTMGERTIVAGLREKYKKNELIGKQTVVVTNLEPRELKGVVSNGMLLACDDGTLLVPEKKIRNGSALIECNEQLTLEEFMKNDFVIRNGIVHCNGEPLHADGVVVRPVSPVDEGMKVR